MWVVWLVSGGTTAALLATLALFRSDFRQAARGWQLLAVSGIALAVAGLSFVVRFWRPTPGPYMANELYPLGPYVNAWAVSFGFAWLAFGIVFVGLALSGAREESVRSWVVLLVSWVLCWLPHGIIGIGFAWAGHNTPSVRFYRDWAAQGLGWLVLSTSALILLAHFSCSIVGFVLTGRQLWSGRGTRAARGVSGFG
jgi:hypothetical protein